MIDISLDWGSDVSAGPGGDLATATDADVLTQRICRRLLTNAGDYIWQLDYGASLGLFVGIPADPDGIEAVIRSQMLLETAVPASPPPAVSAVVTDQANGIVTANITYADPASLAPVSVAITTPANPLS
ncbi:MAG: hypothetical protein B7Z80_14195 [Rhodospirillales bacterium 20-64-7]|nr:MAG: hypothetical protein B7Z80_14195 [Rhodospirillales bacterium 20-64-7]HQT78263.1 hypothetical protein [Rhodopila sp.]